MTQYFPPQIFLLFEKRNSEKFNTSENNIIGVKRCQYCLVAYIDRVNKVWTSVPPRQTVVHQELHTI